MKKVVFMTYTVSGHNPLNILYITKEFTIINSIDKKLIDFMIKETVQEIVNELNNRFTETYKNCHVTLLSFNII